MEAHEMGFFDLFKQPTPTPEYPTVMTVLPPAAAAEIQRGRLPQINTTSIFMKGGEVCHFVDNAILIKDRTVTSYVRKGGSYSMPGLFSGTRIRFNQGRTTPDEQVVTEQFNGVLYITNKRIIFQAIKNGFEKAHTSLTSIAPYTNAVDLQYGSTSYRLLVPDGELLNRLMGLLP
ncbi:MAG: hypothetical protein LBC63_00715 [Holophagales bacterium]|nr:hypothetical protein [Holophagales bacterium]